MAAHQTRIRPDATAKIETRSRALVLDRDLIVLALIGALVPLVPLIPVAIVRVPLGLVLALGLPGYALITALFPERRVLDGVTRTALTFGLSIALIPILTLMLSALPWGIRPWPITISLSIWTLALTGAAIWRRRALDETTPPGGDEHPQPPWWQRQNQSLGRYVLFGGTMLGVGTIALAGGWFIHPPSNPTEFYVLGSDGMVEQYPRQVTPSDEIELTVGIVSGEPEERAFSVEVWAVDVTGSSAAELLTTAGPVVLQPETSEEFAVSFRMPWIGTDQQVDMLLYRDGDDEPYRLLQLWIDVVESPSDTGETD